ncbi:MAG: alpha/beta hydrolase [Planctomycetes bacterium]|nr:alpha/beta hydrolase [Planctomycetota bacterium]
MPHVASYGDHDDLKALLGYLGISKANIAGWSMGCVIAVDFVLAYPEMSNSLIAVGPWVNGYTAPSADLEAWRKIYSIAKESGQRAAAEFCINLHTPPRDCREAACMTMHMTCP